MSRLAALLFFACACVSAAVAAPIAGLKSGLFEPPRAAPAIAGVIDLEKYRGKVVALEFGFTHCTEVCPVSLASLAQARKLLGADADQLQVVFVSVDPARDTAAALRTYLAQFDPGFVGIGGTQAQIDAVLKAYGIAATRQALAGSPAAYSMHHSSYLYFVDRRGMLRALMPFGRPAADIAHDVRLLLRN